MKNEAKLRTITGTLAIDYKAEKLVWVDDKDVSPEFLTELLRRVVGSIEKETGVGMQATAATITGELEDE